MFKKLDSFTRHHQLSRTHSVSVCADGAYSAMIKIKTTLSIYEKGKQKYVSSYCLLHREKNQLRRNLRSDSF